MLCPLGKCLVRRCTVDAFWRGVANYANGKPAKPGDMVLDISSGELLIVERVDSCPTINTLCHPVFGDGMDRDSRSLIPIADARNILHRAAKALTP